MNKLYKGLAVLGVAILLAPVARAADEVPNFNKRGDNEKEFAKRVGMTIVKKARPTTKDFTLQDHKFKEVKPGRTELHLEIGYKGATGFTKYTAKPVVTIDTSNKDKWEVLKIEYEDNNRLTFSRKNLENLVKEFNDASK